MPDYHVDDVFHVENRTFNEEDRSQVTKALLSQLGTDNNNHGPKCALNPRASIPEVVTDHVTDAYEPSVSQHSGKNRHVFFNCHNGEFLQSEHYHISDGQIVDMTRLNFYTEQDRQWSKEQCLRSDPL